MDEADVIHVRGSAIGCIMQCRVCGVKRILRPGESVHDTCYESRPIGRTILQWFELEHQHPRANTIRLGTLEMIDAERRAMPRKKSADGTEDLWQDGW